MAGTLEVMVTQGNVKKIDCEANGIVKRDMWTQVKIGDVVHKTTVKPGTLDCVWDETFTFNITDPINQKLEVLFFMGEKNIGPLGTYNLDSLKEGVSTYKGLAVPGGKIDMQLRALGFGKKADEKEEEGDADWMSFV